jgi:hypothetical protein
MNWKRSVKKVAPTISHRTTSGTFTPGSQKATSRKITASSGATIQEEKIASSWLTKPSV